MKAYFNPAHSSIQYDPVTMGIILTGAAVASAGAGAATAVNAQKAAKKEKNAANDAIKAAEDEANQKALQAQQEQDKTSAARRKLLDTPTSGFGPNKNLARSFLTSL